jgi:xanthine/CO dehydrogenase XdhC/CoxF family maturation factor
MLIAEHRWIAGSVSGGCLERDVLFRGAFHTRDHAAAVVRYDSTSDFEGSIGLGCNGVVDVLLERIDERTELDPTRFIADCFAAEEKGALVTVFASDDPGVPVGARVAVRGGVESTLDETARGALVTLARDALARGTPPFVHTWGGVMALVEVFSPPPHLFVIGTRHDALPLVTLARAVGLGVTVADAWADGSTRARLAADHFVFGSPADVARAIEARSRAAVVVMTHDYERDREYLAAAIATRARYIGVLGPRARTARMLAEADVELDEALFARLHAPVGLDLGAETPSEIALAIVAEVQAAFAGRSARRLRETRGPIHAPGERESPADELAFE